MGILGVYGVYLLHRYKKQLRSTPRMHHIQDPISIRHFHRYGTEDYKKCSPTGRHVLTQHQEVPCDSQGANIRY